jgi:uncharacterized membrane protein YphA (DoxX/SURF4 family)
MRVALVYPPSCDPTAPYLSVPTLTAWLRKNGIEVVPIDANLESCEHLLRREHLEALRATIERRLALLEQKPSLSHEDQLVYAQLWRARGDAEAVPSAIEDALAVLRDGSGERFYDPAAYEPAIATVDAALRVASAACAPLAAVPLLIVMLVAVVTTKIPILLEKGFWAMAHEARTDFAVLLGCWFLALVGAGAYSLDARIAPLRARYRGG